MSFKRILFGVVALGLSACGADDIAEITPVSDPGTVRMTTSGEVIGSTDKHDTYAWRGIPFAAPPVGDLRWRAPQPVAAWEGRREALSFGPACIQFWSRLSGMEGSAGEVAGSEDCLTLNIWSPQDRSGPNRGPLPVMVWIHGGGNTVGAARTYAGDTLAGKQDVVVVTINYRLGLLGWFSHPAIRGTATDPTDASGNFGTLDTIAALDWISANIAQFGGDPSNVTVFGESAGGRNVYALMASPLAKGLFHKAISQSGSLSTTPLHIAENYADDETRGMTNSSREIIAELLQREGKATDRETAKAAAESMSHEETLGWLRQQTPTDLLAGTVAGLSGMYRAPQMFHDGVVLTAASPRKQFDDPSSYNAVPLMTGTNRDESKLFMAQDPEWVSRFLGLFVSVSDQEQYDLVAAYQSDHWKARAVDTPAERIVAAGGAPVFAYRWDWDEGASNMFVDYSTLLGAAHGMEISFVFGDFERGLLPGFFDDNNVEARDKLSDAMMSYWTQFAYSGDPGKGRKGELLQWGAWGSQAGDFIILDTEADGGIRMTSEGVTLDDMKSRLAAEESLPPQKRCELYASMFFLFEGNNDHWDQEQFNTLGCGEMNPYTALRGF